MSLLQNKGQADFLSKRTFCDHVCVYVCVYVRMCVCVYVCVCMYVCVGDGVFCLFYQALSKYGVCFSAVYVRVRVEKCYHTFTPLCHTSVGAV